MLTTTLPHLRCPKRKKQNSSCGGKLTLKGAPTAKEISTGTLECLQCKSRFPILAGVAVLVPDVREYLLTHVKGIAQIVPDSEIPKEFLREFLQAKEEIEVEHIEEDLEAERVVALYLMNHYLRVSKADPNKKWWTPQHGTGSPLIDQLVRDYWDQGPFAQIQAWVSELHQSHPIDSVIELGCGVGGLCLELEHYCNAYLGVDSSFASIALARHLVLGTPYPRKIRIPKDLLQGSVSFDPELKPKQSHGEGRADFIVGDLESLPVQRAGFDLSIALNAIDMLDDPSVLPKLQRELVRKEGIVLQSCPYIWHESVSRRLRGKIPKSIRDSAKAVEWLYEQEGLTIEKRIDHLPWLFFKHVRQLEIYSVHLFMARAK